MHLDDKPQDQLRMLVDWLRLQAEADIPAPVGWEILKEGMRRRALFLEGFTVPSIDAIETSKRPFLAQALANVQDNRPSILMPRPEGEGVGPVTKT